ncbi:transmembrane protein 59-like [Saccoglossus kowalevskii]|uniref:Transmembrane protein 59-like n=1 Tax=Saccoglossus kowalevskii TaxID=10224 RepID=A0ABM0GVN1_SACKO|nr:PREDICTED: transmembrane protein 59-like [Saccoglossus kowalevskii]
MAPGRVFLLTLVCTLSSKFVLSSDIFNNILDDVSPCVNVCDDTYSPETILDTDNKVDDLNACKRGCRMFSVMELIVDQSDDFNTTYQHCSAACSEAYQLSLSSRYACNLGCKSEVPFAKQRQQDVEDLPPRIHILEPLMMVRSFYNNFVDNARSYASWSWSMYVESENGKVYMFSSEPEIYTANPSMERLVAGSDKIQRDMETNLQPIKKDESTMYPDIDNNSDWLGCVSKKSGLPRWVLSATILLSSMALLWLCCATAVTAPDQRVPKEKLSIYGDLEYLSESKGKYPYPIYIKPTLAHGDDEAEPLPIKIDISKEQSQI